MASTYAQDNRFCATESSGSAFTRRSRNCSVTSAGLAAAKLSAAANPLANASTRLIARVVIDDSRAQGLMRCGKERELIAERHIVRIHVISRRQRSIRHQE